MVLSEKIFDAINVAARIHDGQYRKAQHVIPVVPFIVHPVRVGMTVMRMGFPEDVIIAGILHDSVEDTECTIEDIQSLFGNAVALLVEKLTDSDNELSFAERKKIQAEKYLDAAPELKAIKAADLYDNIRSTVIAKRSGEDIFKALSHPIKEYIKFQRQLLDAIQNEWEHPLCDEIENYLCELESF